MDKKFNFTVSSIIAFGSYFLVIISIVLYLKSDLSETQKYSTIPEDTIVELNIEIDDIKVQETLQQQEEVVEESTKDSIQENQNSQPTPNIKSLFSSVSEVGTKKDENKPDESQKQQNMSRFKSKLDDNQKQQEKIELKKLVDLKDVSSQSKSISTPSSKGKFDEYYSMINTLILKRWYRYPLVTDQNYFVSASITIDSKGNFSYVMLKYSGDTKVDEAVKQFLKDQTFEKYPPPLDGVTKTIKINFMPFVQ